MMEALPAAVWQAMQQLEDAGYEAYLVGGCVRDLLRGVQPHDYDLATSALPQETKTVFQAERVLETGLHHGTVTLLTSDAGPLEITTYRTDGTYTDGRHPDQVSFSRCLEEDLARRDFTVNAMAWSPRRGLVDCYGGQADLQNRILRCVGVPKVRFAEDALRILRGARFASCLGFAIEPATASAMLESAPLLRQISAERISSEFVRMLCGEQVESVLLQFQELFAVFLPELIPCFSFNQRSPYHEWDVYTHICKTVAAVPPKPILRLAALFHDIAKPDAFTLRDGRGHFTGHPVRGEVVCRQAMERLRFPRAQIRDVCILVREHDFALKLPAAQAARELLQRVPTHLTEDLLQLMAADASAKANPERAGQMVSALWQAVTDLRESHPCLHRSDLAVDGNDLLAVGVPSGRGVGDAITLLLEAVMAGRVPNQKEALLHFYQEMRR